MTSRCIDPAVGDALLDDARPGGRGFQPEQLRHLEACVHCRTSVEQLRRLVGTWHALEPGPDELRSARRRLAMRSTTKRKPKRVLSKAAALVVVLAAAAASAAVRVVVTRLSAPPVAVAAAVDEPTATKEKARHRGGHRGASLAGADGVGDPVAVEAPPVAPETPPVEALPGVAAPPAVEAPPVLVSPPPAETLPKRAASPSAEVAVDDLPVAAPAPHRAAAAPPAAPPAAVLANPVPVAPVAPPSAPPAPPPGPWVVAATAMRNGDYAGAEAAFGELARSADRPTRDAARLARAQVWVGQGRAGEARPELEDLAASGATPLVRKRAADALAGLR